MKSKLREIGFRRVREPRWCENCRFEKDVGMHGFSWKCTHPVSGKIVSEENTFHCTCKYHVSRGK